MTMTLEEIKKGMSDKVFSQIVDIFLRQSTILQMLTFDDCVSASGGGSQPVRSGAFESRGELEATIKNSMSIIENFKP